MFLLFELERRNQIVVLEIERRNFIENYHFVRKTGSSIVRDYLQRSHEHY